MHIRICKNFFTLLCVIFLWVSAASADNLALSIVDRTSGLTSIAVAKGEWIHLEVRVDNAAAVAGASFTVTYDSANLSLRAVNPVTSSFFDTFVNQGLLTDPAYITVDSVDYYSPIVDNLITGGVMIAGARFNNGTGSNVEIFTLHFKATGSPGTYPIAITPSIISNTAAGYAAGGEAIPLLVGIDGNSYPVHTVTTTGASVVINPVFVDTDNDKIDDNWEIANAPAGTPAGSELLVFTASGDYDHDGYSDYQEYLNNVNGVLDPDGQPFNPTVRNSPNGTGYVPLSIPAINMLLLGN